MKIKLLFIFLIIQSSVWSQVGIQTASPTEDLDVNGTVRIRALSDGLVVANSSGVLSISNLIKPTAGHELWSKVLVGGKSSLLFFVGRAAVLGTDLAFIVHYDPNSGSFSVVSNSNCTVTNLGMTAGNNGRLRVHVLGVNYTLVFVNTSGYSTISSTPAWFQGTFFSITHSL